MKANLINRIERLEERLLPREAPQWLLDRLEAKLRGVNSFDWGEFDRLCLDAFEKYPPRPEVIADLERHLRWKEQHPWQN